jgi:hypothetical protein
LATQKLGVGIIFYSSNNAIHVICSNIRLHNEQFERSNIMHELTGYSYGGHQSSSYNDRDAVRYVQFDALESTQEVIFVIDKTGHLSRT